MNSTNLQKQQHKIKSLAKTYLIFFFALVLLALSYTIAMAIIQHFIDESVAVGQKIVTTSPLESINLFVTVSLMLFGTFIIMGGIVVAYFYVQDALYEEEHNAVNKIGYFFGLFAAGGVLGYFLTKSVILPFLISVNTDLGISASTNLQNLVLLYVTNVLIVGFMFEIPLVVKIMNMLSVIDKTHLRKARRAVYITTLILIAWITPTTDFVTLALMMVPTLILYEISILLCNNIKLKEAFPGLLGRRF